MGLVIMFLGLGFEIMEGSEWWFTLRRRHFLQHLSIPWGHMREVTNRAGSPSEQREWGYRRFFVGLLLRGFEGWGIAFRRVQGRSRDSRLFCKIIKLVTPALESFLNWNVEDIVFKIFYFSFQKQILDSGIDQDVAEISLTESSSTHLLAPYLNRSNRSNESYFRSDNSK